MGPRNEQDQASTSCEPTEIYVKRKNDWIFLTAGINPPKLIEKYLTDPDCDLDFGDHVMFLDESTNHNETYMIQPIPNFRLV